MILIAAGIVLGACLLGGIIIAATTGSDPKPVAGPTAPATTEATTEAATTEPTTEATTKAAPTTKAISVEEQNAIESARSYLEFQPFSRKGLIRQLSSDAGEGYPVKVATRAVDSLHVDWNEQAAKAAKQYLSSQSFSRKGLIQQLESDAGRASPTRRPFTESTRRACDDRPSDHPGRAGRRPPRGWCGPRAVKMAWPPPSAHDKMLAHIAADRPAT